MSRLLVTLILLISPTFALAVVQPPLEDLQKDPTLQQRWEQMAPILNDWEFKPQPKVSGPGTESYEVIVENLGQAGIGEARPHDLNHDGTLDQFDILELGYEARVGGKGTSVAPPKGTNKIFLMRADFADQDANYATNNVAYFNQRFFQDDATPNQSFRDYFQQVSYGDLDITGTVYADGPEGDGWFKGSQNRNWYRDTAGGARILIAESVEDADPHIDFSEFDVDGDGYVDCFMIFYPQLEFSGSLWPHRSSGMNIHVDGVIIDSYFICGIHSTDAYNMEISCHEYGHILGLPDLYDVGGPGPGSNGMGVWSLMAYQYNGSQRPPSPDPWCKCQLGWVKPEVITGNVTGKELDRFQDNREVLKVWRNGKEEDQYFLLANYRQVLTDTPRPGQGLLILHIDETKTGGNGDNSDAYRKHVDVVSARGWHPDYDDADPNLLDLLDITNANGGSNGHANDLWRNTNPATPTFNDTSNPHAKKNNHPSASTNSEIEVNSISAAGDTMTMNIIVDTANKPTCDITAPSDGADVSGNVQIDVTATPAGGRTISSVDFYCNGAYLGSDTGSPYTLTFDSRSIFNGSRVIRAVATDNQGDIDIDEVTVDLDNAASTYPYSDAFGSNINAWASYNFGGSAISGAYRRWQHFNTAVSGRTGTAGIGSTSNGYGYNEHDELVSLRVDLTGTTAPLARWKQRFRVSSGENTVKVFITADEGATYDLLYSNTGDERTWLPVAVDLTDYIGEQVRLIFRLDSSTLSRSTGDSGWWIDDFFIKDTSDPPSVLSITPGDGSAISGTQTITVTASDDEGIAAVEFWINGSDRIAVDNVSPYTFNWNSDWVFDGSHEFTAVALDDDMLSGEASVDWTTSNPGTAVPWAEPFNSAPTNAWRTLDFSGGASWFWGSGLGQAGGGMKFGKVSGTYDDGENDHFISPTLTLGSLADPSISFLHRFDFEQNYDFGRLYVATDLGSWSLLGSWSQTNQTTWRPDGFRLDSYSGQKIKLRWFGESDTGVTEDGWWIDDLNLRSAPQITSVTPSRIEKGQTPSITVTGSGFGNNGAIEASSIRLGSNTLSTTSWSSDGTQIQFTLPAGAASGNLVVKRRGVDSDPFWLQVILPPPSLGGLEQQE